MIKHLSADEIASILTQFTHLSNPGIAESQRWGQTFTSFSDLAVRTVPIRKHDNLPSEQGMLYWELLDLAFIQAELIERGILIRGAITVGNLCAPAGLLFGPALVRGYELENRVAIYPRIIVDTVVFDRLNDTPELRMQDKDQKVALKTVLAEDGDRVWFVDYLKAKEHEMISNPSGFVKYLQRHKEVVSKFLESNSELSDRSSKHGWIAHYHNRTVQSLSAKLLEQANASAGSLFLS